MSLERHNQAELRAQEKWLESVNAYLSKKLPYPLSITTLNDIAYRNGLRADVELLEVQSEYGSDAERKHADSILEIQRNKLAGVEAAVEGKMIDPKYKQAYVHALKLYFELSEDIAQHIPPLRLSGLDEVPLVQSQAKLAFANLGASNVIGSVLHEKIKMN